MLKKLLKLSETQQLSKNEQRTINGGGARIPSACTYPGAPPFGGPCFCFVDGQVCRVQEDFICLDGIDPICPNF
ncbi:hypothetical protein [Aquimarina algiphila]|uniref:Bacteriocin n=1 Tax=Aquimarina algiphila TaxID=2047982 RepID=A0A554VC13_9FLAO|nr:hypothetical protein [Aquimarina algiphila]TSE04127.1 hypothetical protein FOF46_27450 [Aquimarina algiphila]